jgi:hypothetical protein
MMKRLVLSCFAITLRLSSVIGITLGIFMGGDFVMATG